MTQELWKMFLKVGLLTLQSPLEAHDVLEIFSLEDIVPVPVDDIAKRLGVTVELCEDDEYNGLISMNGRLHITQNKSTPKVTQRFLLAHELARLFLGQLPSQDGIFALNELSHRDVDIFGMAHRGVAATHFAAQLLMPTHLVRKMAVHAPDIQALADYFDVSSAAMSYRLRGLGMRL